MLEIDEKFIDSIRSKYKGDITKLNLSNNGLKKIGGISQLSSTLTKLNLSKNALANISPLSQLSILSELDISENQISDAECLRGLKSLEFLNLMGNKISQLSQLDFLRDLSKLRTLKLEGNSICHNVIDYPLEIFKLQSSVEYIDKWERDQVMIQSTNNTHGTNHSTNRSTVSSSSTLVPSTRSETLELQIKALQDAFQYQEELLAMQAKAHLNTPQYQYMLHRYTSLASFKSKSTTKGNALSSNDTMSMPRATHEELLHSFPYYALLHAWRQKVLQCMVQESMHQASYQKLLSKQQQERHNTKQQLQEKELLCLKQTQSIQAYELRIQSYSQQLQQQKQDHEQLLHSTKALQRKHSFYYQQYLKLVQYFLALQDDVTKDQVLFVPSSSSSSSASSSSKALFATVVQQLGVYEKRLSGLQNKIEDLSIALHQKELTYRNNTANQELLQRLQLLRFQKQLIAQGEAGGPRGNDEHHGREMGIGKGQEKARGGKKSTHRKQESTTLEQDAEVVRSYLSEIILTAEMESLLKSIFVKLDVLANGMVEVTLFVQALLSATPTPYQLHVTESENESDGDSDGNESESDEDSDASASTASSSSAAAPRQGRTKRTRQESTDAKTKEAKDEEKIYWKYWMWMQKAFAHSQALSFFQWLRQQVTPVGQLLFDTLGMKRFGLLVFNLLRVYAQQELQQQVEQKPIAKTLTWGEFLTQFVPSSLAADPFFCPAFPEEFDVAASHCCGINLMGRARLTREEYRALQQLELLDHHMPTFDLQHLPLHLPSTTSTTTAAPLKSSSAPKTHPISSSPEELLQENKRLKAERVYLLQQIQHFSKAQIRQAEEIKYYFEHELKVYTKQIVQWQHRYEESEDQKAQYHQRMVEMKEHYTQQLTALETQCTHLATEYEKVLKVQQGTKEEALVHSEQQLLAARQQIAQLESKVSILTSQSSQKEVKINTLTRSINRLESTFQKEIDQLKGDKMQQEKDAEEAHRLATEKLHTQEEIITKQQEEITRLKQALEEMTLKANASPPPPPAPAVVAEPPPAPPSPAAAAVPTTTVVESGVVAGSGSWKVDSRSEPVSHYHSPSPFMRSTQPNTSAPLPLPPYTLQPLTTTPSSSRTYAKDPHALRLHIDQVLQRVEDIIASEE